MNNEKLLLQWVENCPPKIPAHLDHPIVTLCGKRVFADVISYRS